MFLYLALSCATWVYASFEPIMKSELPTVSADSVEIPIRVRIQKAESAAKIRGYDLQIYAKKDSALSPKVFAPEATPLSPILVVDKISDWQMHCNQGKVYLRSSNARTKEIVLEDLVSFKTPVGFINYAGNPYRDEIRVYSIAEHCEVVNILDLEKYLDGLVNSEFSSKWNEESIEAQVVAARTYAYFQIQEARAHRDSYYDLDATVKDQVYNGSLRESFHSSIAATKTKGLVLTAKGGNKIFPIKAYYHSTCGGLTELPENVWGRVTTGFKRKVTCPYCAASPRFRWDLEVQSGEILKAFLKGIQSEGIPPEWPKQAWTALKQNRILDISIANRDQEGRVIRLMTLWANGKTVVSLPLSGVKFRDWMGTGRLKSTWFNLVATGRGEASRWHFLGRGFGHGVGLCQWGAKTMGEKGFKMAAILKHYYPDAALRKFW
jgi:stage II sporulation protein D